MWKVKDLSAIERKLANEKVKTSLTNISLRLIIIVINEH